MLSARALEAPTDILYFNTRTPGRALRNRAENDYAGMAMSMTVNGKGKNANRMPRTPFHPASAKLQHTFKDQKTGLTSTTRPLAHKTPLPTGVGKALFKTPLPARGKLSKLKDDGEQLEEESNITPDSSQRPSSMRIHIKHRRTSGKPVLETPMNNGNHWDVSDGDIVLQDVQPTIQETTVEGGDDLDELEYGPPNTLDIPYEPPFDFPLPDYKEVGKSLFQLARSLPRYELAPPAELDIPPTQLEVQTWDLMPLPELESDDPFDVARAKPPSSSNEEAPRAGGTHHKTLPSSKGIHGATHRPQSSMARIGATASSSRPASRAAPLTTAIVGKKTTASTTTSKSSLGKPTVATTSSTKTSLTVRARPPMNPARAALIPSRPHTSMSAKSNLRAARTESGAGRSLRPGKLTPNATVSPKEANIIVFKDMATDLEGDLDFRFDV
ncbi:hypothetical protein CVT26_011986 [Gymnopilus dilepis]|uniref:Uncharacterized protein n=1 Tax=Gymnopilus dilepis TaxID=231916 RepID=A0A409VYM2_9AGAR|nr:hypothetical protein CVT26_011986 [Gymnopilus dilepis]